MLLRPWRALREQQEHCANLLLFPADANAGIQIYAPTSSAEEAEVVQFYEDLQDLLKLTPKDDVLCIIGDWAT